MKIIVAITAASGAIYSRLVLEHLIRSSEVERIALIMSDNAAAVVEYEGEQIPSSEKIERMDNHSMFSSVASGSAQWDAMIVVPSSMGTVGRVAAGISQTLIERAADVMLKERRPLVMVVRESPYSLIHLRNMTSLTEAGAIILPASPSFYFAPATIEELCLPVTLRALEFTGLEIAHREWGEEQKEE